MGTSRHPAMPLSHRCPLGSINGNHSGQNTVSSLSSDNDFSAYIIYSGAGPASDQLH